MDGGELRDDSSRVDLQYTVQYTVLYGLDTEVHRLANGTPLSSKFEIFSSSLNKKFRQFGGFD